MYITGDFQNTENRRNLVNFQGEKYGSHRRGSVLLMDLSLSTAILAKKIMKQGPQAGEEYFSAMQSLQRLVVQTLAQEATRSYSPLKPRKTDAGNK